MNELGFPKLPILHTSKVGSPSTPAGKPTGIDKNAATRQWNSQTFGIRLRPDNSYTEASSDPISYVAYQYASFSTNEDIMLTSAILSTSISISNTAVAIGSLDDHVISIFLAKSNSKQNYNEAGAAPAANVGKLNFSLNSDILVDHHTCLDDSLYNFTCSYRSGAIFADNQARIIKANETIGLFAFIRRDIPDGSFVAVATASLRYVSTAGL